MSDLLEREFERQVIDLALIFGYETAHFRPAKTSKGWRTPVSGTLGQGWPDWFFTRTRDGRTLFRELKSERGRLSDEQAWVLVRLTNAGHNAAVWRPSDMDSGLIEKELRG